MAETQDIAETAREPRFAGVSREEVKKWYALMHLGRVLDDKAPNYLKQGLGWSYHAPCAGHDAIQLALGLTFRPARDYLFPYYRDLTTCLAAGLTAEEILLNGTSKATDVASGGRHMSNHFAKPSIGIQNVSSCVSNHSQHAAGLARAVKTYHQEAIVFASMGESSLSEGYFSEALNGASHEKLPVVFVVQDNGYGISVPKSDQTANLYSSDNFSGYKNVKIIHCDGLDVFDSFRAMREAVAFVRTGAGTAIVHARCVRIHSHSNSDRQDLYRTPEELAAARAADPLPRFRKLLTDTGLVPEEDLRAIEAQNERTYEESTDRARQAPEPDPATIYENVVPESWTSERWPDGIPDGTGDETTLVHALNETLKEEFRHNPDTYIWGQDVAYRDKGGVFNVTKGMQQEFGSTRVFNAPIAEDFIMGTANGFCRLSDKIRVVVEGAEFADYFWPAAEQMIEMSHEYWRTNGQYVPNVTVRLPSGGYIGGGLYHSQNLEGWLATLPGIRIVVPAFADDAAGLLRTAMRSRGVTLYLEPKFLYNSPMGRAKVPAEFAVPFGKARVAPRGNGPDDRRLRDSRALRPRGLEGPRDGRQERRGDRPALARADGHGRGAHFRAKDQPRPGRPRGQGPRRLRRRDRIADPGKGLRAPRRPDRPRRLGVHAGRVQPGPRARGAAEQRQGARGGAKSAVVLRRAATRAAPTTRFRNSIGPVP